MQDALDSANKRVEYHRLYDMLKRHEGLRLQAYKCPAGRTTIGYGRNLDDLGITAAEAAMLLQNDVARILEQAHAEFPWFKSLSAARQDVIVSMVFNLGLAGFKRFEGVIRAIICGNFEKAADNMLSSKWSGQVGSRATELAKIMRNGIY